MENYLITYLSKRYKNFEFVIDENSFHIIKKKYINGVTDIIGKQQYDKWKGKYLILLNSSYFCIDNSTGDCWCEVFKNYQNAIDWLNEKFELE